MKIFCRGRSKCGDHGIWSERGQRCGYSFFEKPNETLGDKINLMPKDESRILWEDEETVVDYTEDGLTIQAGPNGAEVIYFLDPICYNIENKPYLNFSLENEGGWDMFLYGYGKRQWL